MSRFSDVVSRQLDLFSDEEVREAKGRYDRAPRDEAEEAFGDFMDAVDAAKDELADMRNAFASTLDESLVDEYEETFERAARRRWRWLS